MRLVLFKIRTIQRKHHNQQSVEHIRNVLQPMPLEVRYNVQRTLIDSLVEFLLKLCRCPVNNLVGQRFFFVGNYVNNLVHV